MLLQENGEKAKTWKKEGLIALVIFFLLIFVTGLIAILSEAISNPSRMLNLEFVGSFVFVVSFITFFTICVWRYWRFYRTLYRDPVYFIGVSRIIPFKNSCSICKRHPTSKRYHIKNVHGLQSVKVKSYFESCGCNLCFPNYQ